MVRDEVQRRLTQALERVVAAGEIPIEGPLPEVGVEHPRSPEHGDFATNVAMVLARPAKMPPRRIAEILKQALEEEGGFFASVAVAGPGFLNLRVEPRVYFEALAQVYEAGAAYGRTEPPRREKICVEFVSANPTGPMHVGHGRGAVTGDVIAELFAWRGHEVVREYYLNDAGAQVDVLATSVYLRYRELHGEEVTLPEDCYPGDYVIEAARKLKARDGARWLSAPESEWRPALRSFAIAEMRRLIEADLDAFNIHFDVWSSEAELKARGLIDEALAYLREKGYLYEADNGAVLFRSTAFGDDKDRAVIKADGSYTYLAGDIAYHWDKLKRGFDRLVNVWGADHAGYVPRVKAAIEALGFDPKKLHVLTVQMVNLTRGGQPVRMGKRSGEFVTLREVIDEVGRDATRIFYIQRRSDAQFDFDLELAKKASLDNPVYYLQYGHARMASILRKARSRGYALPDGAVDEAALEALGLPEEVALARRILDFPHVLAAAADALEPHRVVYWLHETIGAFHGYYTKYGKQGERVVSDDPVKTRGRLYLVQALKQVVANGLAVLGVDAPERMEWGEGAEAAGDPEAASETQAHPPATPDGAVESRGT
ncbi:MAG: arginine--tRNA ligase [Deltaproteobacteria bacterium]|nr:MAG: arginine--tRNA ligase [Deltaproteobacteria bacterium]